MNNRTFRGKFVFRRKNLLLQTFRVLMRNSADFCRKELCPIWKTAFYTRSRYLFDYHYRFPRENLRPLTDFKGKRLELYKNFLTRWSKLFSLCPEDIFGEKMSFLTESSKLSVFFRLWGKHSGFLAKIIWLGCQKCFQVSRGYFWKSRFWKQIFWIVSFFLDFGNIFFGLSAKIFDRSFKTVFYVSSGNFWLDCFFYEKLWVFSPSSGCEEKIVEFWRKSFKNFFLTAICV